MPEIKDFLPELIGLGVDALICGAMYTAYTGASRIIKDLNEAPVVEIDESLKEQIYSHPKSEKVGSDSVRIPYAVLRGDVCPLGKTFTSAYQPEIGSGVIQKVVFTEHKKNLSRAGLWVDSKRVLHQYTNNAPFCLINPQHTSLSLSKPRVEVVDWSDARTIDLDTVFDKFEQGENSLGSHLLGWASGDMHKGTQITESMLLKGTSLTAVGELVVSPLGVKLIPPTDNKPLFLVKNSLSSLIKDYESGKSVLKVFTGIFAGIGIALAAWTVYKYQKKRKLELANRANEETLNNIRNEREARDREPREDLPDSLQCVVCLGAEREVILLNCGHVCVCADCGGTLIRNNHNCPVCRAEIQSVLPAYVS